jgi:hypothetical protein
MFLALEKKFLDRKQERKDDRFLAISDGDRFISIDRKVYLTSLTERDMTFLLDEEIPYFTVAKMTLPLKGYLTIVPAEGQLPSSKKGTHYRGLIHGLSEESLMKLRKIVNQLIYNPPKEITSDAIEIMLKQDYNKPKCAAANEGHIAKVSPLEKSDPRFTLNRETRGRSKL